MRLPKQKFDSDDIDKLFTRFLRSRVGRKWSSVFRSIRHLCKSLTEENIVYIKSTYELYVELHPVMSKEGKYSRSNGLPFGDEGLFYVDLGGIMRESEKENDWQLLT